MISAVLVHGSHCFQKLRVKRKAFPQFLCHYSFRIDLALPTDGSIRIFGYDLDTPKDLPWFLLVLCEASLGYSLRVFTIPGGLRWLEELF